MADNGGGGGSGNVGAASIVAAVAAVGSAESRFSSRIQQWNGSERRGCWGGLFCFGSDKRTKVVPSSCVPDGNAALVPGNGSRPLGRSNQTVALPQPLLAPPSSPDSFTNSSLPSTAQSPSCFRSILDSSLGEPSSTMFATGPYAHETQLVSPPVFSALTTEPSTTPFTPPELAHQTTPSSPDVPYAHYLSSSMDFKSVDKVTGVVVGNDLQMAYAFDPGSPSSSLISPTSDTPRTGICSPFPDSEIPSHWDGLASSQDVPCTRNGSSKLFSGSSSNFENSMLSLDSSFFCLSIERFHLDWAQQSHQSHASKGRLSITEGDNYTNSGDRPNKAYTQVVEEIIKERDNYTNGGKHNKAYKQDVEKITKEGDNYTNGGNRHNKAYEQDVKEITKERDNYTNGGNRPNKDYKQDVEGITKERDNYTTAGNRHHKAYKQDVEEITKKGDNYTNGGNRHQDYKQDVKEITKERDNFTNGGNRHNKGYKQDAEEITKERDNYNNGGNRHNKAYKQEVEEITKERDNYTNGGNRHNKVYRQDMEELESYRDSFGFSADELVTTPSSVEISDEVDISFSVPSIPSNQINVQSTALSEKEARRECHWVHHN